MQPLSYKIIICYDMYIYIHVLRGCVQHWKAEEGLGTKAAFGQLSMYLACVVSVAWGWDISWSWTYVCVRLCVCYFSGRIGMVHGFPTNSALASGMCWWSVAPCLIARHCFWSKTKESGELNCREITSFFPSLFKAWGGLYVVNGWEMVYHPPHSSHAYSDQLSTHPIPSHHPMCPWQLARSYHASNTVYTHTLTHVHTLTVRLFLSSSFWLTYPRPVLWQSLHSSQEQR